MPAATAVMEAQRLARAARVTLLRVKSSRAATATDCVAAKKVGKSCRRRGGASRLESFGRFTMPTRTGYVSLAGDAQPAIRVRQARATRPLASIQVVAGSRASCRCGTSTRWSKSSFGQPASACSVLMLSSFLEVIEIDAQADKSTLS